MPGLPSLPVPRPDWALFLDVDGTLVEIAETPEAVIVEPRLVDVLGRLQAALGGALALVSGRSIATLDRLFAPLTLPAAGLHGLERRKADGTIVRPAEAAPGLTAIRDAFQAFAARFPGVVIEDKGLTVALHYRRVPAAADEAQALADRLIAEHGDELRLQVGKMLFEFRPPGSDKGDVVAAYMAEAPFAGRVPVFVGDDVTDEDGFATVNRLGGHAIRVGPAPKTVARFQIGDVVSLRDWLDSLPDMIGAPAEVPSSVGNQNS